MSSSSPFVHGFPRPNDDLGPSRLRNRSLSCLLTIASGGFSIGCHPFFFSPSPGRQGFILHSVSRLHRPCFLGTTRESATPAPCSASGSPSRSGFIESLAPLVFQCSRASLGKMHQPPCIPSDFTAVRFTGYQASLSHDGSTSSPRPYSRFAVHYVHRFCLMLPPDPSFLRVPLPCRRCPSVR